MAANKEPDFLLPVYCFDNRQYDTRYNGVSIEVSHLLKETPIFGASRSSCR